MTGATTRPWYDCDCPHSLWIICRMTFDFDLTHVQLGSQGSNWPSSLQKKKKKRVKYNISASLTNWTHMNFDHDIWPLTHLKVPVMHSRPLVWFHLDINFQVSQNLITWPHQKINDPYSLDDPIGATCATLTNDHYVKPHRNISNYLDKVILFWNLYESTNDPKWPLNCDHTCWGHMHYLLHHVQLQPSFSGFLKICKNWTYISWKCLQMGTFCYQNDPLKFEASVAETCLNHMISE